MNNTGIILALAYPETIVRVSQEWFVSYFRFIGIGKKDYVRAGHAALVLIDKATGILEYYDFGRYVTPIATGRVRGKDTDHELDFPIVAKMENNEIQNLNEILVFLATQPKLTHGEGKLIASVCDAVNYDFAKNYITKMQQRDFVKYAVFKKDASNCARFVTDTLIASVTNNVIKNKLKRSNGFTPSTVGNVVIADTKKHVFELSEEGEISEYKSTVSKDNRKYFLDRLKDHTPVFVGSLEPKPVEGLHKKAQWLSGIGSGAWFELHKTDTDSEYIYKRISPYGNVDVHATYLMNESEFDYHEAFEFIHYSNCKFFHIKQNGSVYRFEIKED